ncbi:uncharacterized protein [Medicago truncatula]|uniref:uncharacterized protein n=1 Tax=Medicago truncatula TaxID=3880 RepID=UPI000D2F162D|nr:uncharacterized protein LOC25490604 [Medicago truncatula]
MKTVSKGIFEVALSDLREKGNPHIATEECINNQISKNTDNAEVLRTAPDVVAPEHEKGNSNVSLISDILEAGGKLILEKLNNVIDSVVSMDMDFSNDGKKADIDFSAQEHEITLNVEQHVETSLSNPDNHENVDTIGEDKNLGSKTTKAEAVNSENTIYKGAHSEHSTKKSAPEEQEHDSIEADLEENVYGNKGDEDMVNIDDIISDDTPLAEREVESVAKRLRSNKGKAVLTKAETTKTKTVGVGPKKGWSKVKVRSTAGKTRKRKVVSSDESEYDIEKDILNIIPSASRKSAGKKVVETIANVPINKVSFHLPKNAQRWRFIYHRRLEMERELSEEAIKIKYVMELIQKAGLMKIVSNLGECYEKLAKEFLVNVSESFDNPLSKEYQKVYARGECVNFSPSIINWFLGINEEEVAELKVSNNQVCREITTNQVRTCPKRGKTSGKLSVKYAILNRIGATNWVPTTHSSDIATSLGKFIYATGKKTRMNVGKYIFDQTMKHAKIYALKFPIAFSTLLCNIVETSGNVPAVGLMTKQEIVAALKETCVLLDERKAQFELMIHSLEGEYADADVQAENEKDEEAHDAEDKNEDGAEDSDSSSEVAD